MLTPLSLWFAERVASRLVGERRFQAWQARRAPPRAFPLPPPGLAGHAIIAGYGRVGRVVAKALAAHGIAHVAIETDHGLAEALRADGVTTVWGDATRLEVPQAARPDKARLIVLAMPDAAGCRMVMAMARAANPEIVAAARAHDVADAKFLTREAGVGLVVMGEREIALGIAGFTLRQFGVDAADAQRTLESFRSRPDDAAA